jgi:hypothetical protein
MANEPKPRRSSTTTKRNKKDAPGRNPSRDEDTRREPDHPRSGQRDEDEDGPGSDTDRDSE